MSIARDVAAVFVTFVASVSIATGQRVKPSAARPSSSPTRVKAEIARWGKVIKEANIRAD